MTTITFVRHGNTDWNVTKRAQGHSSNPLNTTGRKQAKAVARRLAETGWDLLISSDLQRAKETAETISTHINKPIAFFDQRIREIGRGKIQGTIERERIEKWGENWHELDLGIESKESLQKRGIEFVEDMIRRFPEKDLLVVSHGLLIRYTLMELLREGTIVERLGNTSVTTISQRDNGWDCLLCNCTAHLKTEESPME